MRARVLAGDPALALITPPAPAAGSEPVRQQEAPAGRAPLPAPTGEQDATTSAAAAASVPLRRWAFEQATIEDFIDHLFALTLEMGLDELIEQAEPTRAQVGTDLMANGDTLLGRLGCIYMLDALARVPNLQLLLFNRLREAVLMIGRGTGLDVIAPPLDADYLQYVLGMPEPMQTSGTEEGGA